MNPIATPVSWWFQKKRHWIDAFLIRNAPAFVYSPAPAAIEGHIPVFTFHSAHPERFDQQCSFLAENGYRTLSAHEYVSAVTRQTPLAPKSIFLTFDDGLKHVWSVAYPILKKHGLRATCFLVPGWVPEGNLRPTLSEYEKGEAKMEDILALEGGEGLCNWSEIRAMQDSGVIDFHSHSLNHHLVPTGPRIFDFVGPGYRPYYFGNIHVPVYRAGDRDAYDREPVPGLPVYQSAPRFQTSRRFFDDPSVREACVSFARDRGPALFQRTTWKKDLHRIAEEARRTASGERYETPEEAARDMREDLARSKAIIEEKMGRPVDQLCFPWYQGSEDAVAIAREVGYRACHFGAIPGRPVNRAGDDPMHTVRVEESFLMRLPGRGRQSVMVMGLDSAGLLYPPYQGESKAQ